MTHVEFRPARAKDIAKFCRYAVPDRFAGTVMTIDGEIAAMGLLVWDALDRAWCVLEVTADITAVRFTFWRAIRKFFPAAKRTCRELYCLQDPAKPMAESLIRALGFVDTGETLNGYKVHKWASKP